MGPLRLGEFLAEGFDDAVDLDVAHGPDRASADATIAKLQALPADRPFFLWVHLVGVHIHNLEKHSGVSNQRPNDAAP